MASSLPLIALNTVLPGSGLILRGSLPAGLTLLIVALAFLTAGVLGLVQRDTPLFAVAGCWAGCGYLATCITSSTVWWFQNRPGHRDLPRIHGLYRKAAAAYLRSDHQTALTSAQELTALLPDEVGAWRLLALTAHGHGSASVATNASQRAANLDTHHH